MSNKTTIISWNINSIGRRYDELKQLAETYNPDYICLQKVGTSHISINLRFRGIMGCLRLMIMAR